MGMRENFQAFYRVLTQDEVLLRLLHYKPSNALDNPLDPLKPDVLTHPDRWEIVEDVIKNTPRTADLTTEPKARVMMYLGRRRKTRNYLMAAQEIIFDVLVHFDIEDVDQRMSWICDRINDLVFDERITGVSKVSYEDGIPFAAPEKYVAFRLTYTVGSEQ